MKYSTRPVTFRRECLDKFVVLGEKHLHHLCREYERYFDSVRPHSALDNEPVGIMDPAPPEFTEEKDGVGDPILVADGA